MAHFIGFTQGNRGEASRLGSKQSGMDATARGWRIGGSLMARHNKETGRDSITLLVDGGSNHRGNSRVVAEFVEGVDDGERHLVNLNGFKLTHIGEDYCKIEDGRGEEYELPLIVAKIFDFNGR